MKKILRQNETLHEHLRNYGQLGEDKKPLVVSAILLALAKINSRAIKSIRTVRKSLNTLKIICNAQIRILSQFRLIKDRPILNEVNRTLNKTPLKPFIYDAVIGNSAEDYLDRFYGEFTGCYGGLRLTTCNQRNRRVQRRE